MTLLGELASQIVIATLGIIFVGVKLFLEESEVIFAVEVLLSARVVVWAQIVHTGLAVDELRLADLLKFVAICCLDRSAHLR